MSVPGNGTSSPKVPVFKVGNAYKIGATYIKLMVVGQHSATSLLPAPVRPESPIDYLFPLAPSLTVSAFLPKQKLNVRRTGYLHYLPAEGTRRFSGLFEVFFVEEATKVYFVAVPRVFAENGTVTSPGLLVFAALNYESFEKFIAAKRPDFKLTKITATNQGVTHEFVDVQGVDLFGDPKTAFLILGLEKQQYENLLTLKQGAQVAFLTSHITAQQGMVRGKLLDYLKDEINVVSYNRASKQWDKSAVANPLHLFSRSNHTMFTEATVALAEFPAADFIPGRISDLFGRPDALTLGATIIGTPYEQIFNDMLKTKTFIRVVKDVTGNTLPTPNILTDADQIGIIPGVKEVDGKMSGVSLVFHKKDLAADYEDSFAVTDPPSNDDINVDSVPTFNITLANKHVGKQSDLSVVKTIIHETLHAYIGARSLFLKVEGEQYSWEVRPYKDVPDMSLKEMPVEFSSFYRKYGIQDNSRHFRYPENVNLKWFYPFTSPAVDGTVANPDHKLGPEARVKSIHVINPTIKKRGDVDVNVPPAERPMYGLRNYQHNYMADKHRIDIISTLREYDFIVSGEQRSRRQFSYFGLLPFTVTAKPQSTALNIGSELLYNALSWAGLFGTERWRELHNSRADVRDAATCQEIYAIVNVERSNLNPEALPPGYEDQSLVEGWINFYVNSLGRHVNFPIINARYKAS